MNEVTAVEEDAPAVTGQVDINQVDQQPEQEVAEKPYE